MKVNYIWEGRFPEKGKWVGQLEPINGEWVKDQTAPFDSYLDLGTYQVRDDGRKKIVILREPSVLGESKNIQLYKGLIDGGYKNFDYIFTYDKEILNLPNARFCPCGNIWWEDDNKYKPKNVSFCCTDKGMVPGHIERRKLADQLGNLVDMKGNYKAPGRRSSTSDIYRDYKFNIAHENDGNDFYFTEKLCNALANRCVPIYYGCTNLEQFGFDLTGIIVCSSRQDIIDFVKNANFEEEYNKRLDAIEFNKKAVEKYRRFEDGLLETYPEIFEELCRS